MRRAVVYVLIVLVLGGACAPPSRAQTASPEEIRSIAKEAYIYGFPLVDNYRIIYSWGIDKANKEYGGPFNTITSEARLFSPDDKDHPNAKLRHALFDANA